ncbi:hypothetical protein D3C72_1899100 [compost metagenome]
MAKGKTLMAIVGVETRRMVSTACPFRLAARRRMPNKSRLSFSVSTNRRCASGFGYSLPRTRSNSGMPSCNSQCCKTLVTAGCEICSTWAAPLMVPTCMMA